MKSSPNTDHKVSVEDMESADITIIGAGVVGLAVAAELSQTRPDVLLIEQHDAFGRETSSRNSEVIHAGIYYPKGSLKARLCVEGRKLLYAFCEQNKIPHRRIGKLIAAIDGKEAAELEDILSRGRANGVEGLRWLAKEEALRMEPNITVEAAIHSPETGIIDSHRLMQTLADQIESRGGMLVYQNRVAGIDRVRDGFEVTAVDAKGEATKVFSRIVINSAGLFADKIAAMVGLERPEYRIKLNKGDYFRVSAKRAKMISHLVYPVPKKDHAGLGVHATLDLAGQMRLGPDDQYVERIDYTVDPAKQGKFYESARGLFPFIEFDDLYPDTSGMRPKLQGPGEPVRDFIIRHEAENGVPGFINLIGIESPGLTSCLAIARMVAAMAVSVV